MGEKDSRNKWIPKYQNIMRALNKHSKNNEVSLPKTLGEKLLAFGRDKLKTLTKNVHQVEANDFFKIKVHSISKMDQFSQSVTDDRKKKITPLNFNDFLISDFEKDRDNNNFLKIKVSLMNKMDSLSNSINENRKKKITPLNFSNFFIPDFEKRDNQEKAQSEQSTILPLKIQELFSKWLKLRLPAIRIYQGSLSDKFLKARHADAMTNDRDIYFQKGKFDLKSVRGLGLLGHELTHSAQQQPEDWQNSSSKYNTEQMERTALDNERFVVQRSKIQDQFTNLSPMLTSVPPSGSLSAIQTGNVSSTPMFADSSRNVGEFQDLSSETLNMSLLSENEMMRIKDEIYRDLMMRIKVEFERGA